MEQPQEQPITAESFSDPKRDAMVYLTMEDLELLGKLLHVFAYESRLPELMQKRVGELMDGIKRRNA